MALYVYMNSHICIYIYICVQCIINYTIYMCVCLCMYKITALKEHSKPEIKKIQRQDKTT